jgi:DNA-directed RNA polymerase specialized sigma24 family protein
VDEALKALAVRHPRAAHVVELRYFGGFELTEIAKLLDMPLRTTEFDWKFAKAWLHAHLS